MSNVQEAFAPAPGKVKPWENIAIPDYPLMKLVRPPAVPRASLALPATARRSLALSARQVEAAFTFMAEQATQVEVPAVAGPTRPSQPLSLTASYDFAALAE